ncbi:UNVERIFIED_CONTAM: hypothetical protein K2H54_038822 [Gekko kuhli]
MELLHQVRGMQVRSGFPGAIVRAIAFPVDEVLQVAPVYPGIEDLLDLVLFFLIHQDRWWWCSGCIPVGIRRGCQLEEGAMEHWVDPEVVGQEQTKGNRVDLGDHLVGADEPCAEFMGTTRGPEVTGGQPYEVAHFERRPLLAVSISCQFRLLLRLENGGFLGS